MKNVFDAMAKKEKKKDCQCEENIELSAEEFDLDKGEVLINLMEAADDRISLVINKNNKISDRIVRETHLDEEYVVGSQTDEILENIILDKNLTVSVNKFSRKDITYLSKEFRLFKFEIE